MNRIVDGDKHYFGDTVVASRYHQQNEKWILGVIFLFGEFAALNTLWTVTFIDDTRETCCRIIFWTFTVDTIGCIDPSTSIHLLLTISLTTPGTMWSILDLLTGTVTTSPIAQMSTRCGPFTETRWATDCERSKQGGKLVWWTLTVRAWLERDQCRVVLWKLTSST